MHRLLTPPAVALMQPHVLAGRRAGVFDVSQRILWLITTRITLWLLPSLSSF